MQAVDTSVEQWADSDDDDGTWPRMRLPIPLEWAAQAAVHPWSSGDVGMAADASDEAIGSVQDHRQFTVYDEVGELAILDPAV